MSPKPSVAGRLSQRRQQLKTYVRSELFDSVCNECVHASLYLHFDRLNGSDFLSHNYNSVTGVNLYYNI